VARNKASDAGSSCDVTGLARGQMALFRCNFCINVEEWCLDEKLIGTTRQCDDSFDVLVVIADVNHVGNFLSVLCARRAA
jgi:hypothetical protein